MTAELLQRISDTLKVEPHAVVVAAQDDRAVHDVYCEYNGVVTKLASFFIPSDALWYGEYIKEKYPEWQVLAVRRMQGLDVLDLNSF